MKGLTPTQVEESRKKFGINILTPKAKESLWRKFLSKFKDPLIIILLIAGALSIGISFYEYYALQEGFEAFFEPVGIFIAIILATGMAFLFELKADKEFAILNQVNDDEPVQVVRDDHDQQIPRKDVVVGDIVILTTGEEVPADGRLIESTQLSVDESTLTGEPLCAKTTDPLQFDPNATFESDMVMRGTKVMEGHGVMEVTAIGDATEQGKVYEAAQIDDSVKTPLNEQLDRLGRFISLSSYVIAGLIIIGRLFFYLYHLDGALDWIHFSAFVLQTIMIAVTLIVVAVPEGLPMAVTLSLAYSMRRMLQTNNLVRKLHACETMGATTVICTDKTGTLTENRMQVANVNTFGNVPDEILYEGIAVNSTARLGEEKNGKPEVLGNPTEGALLLWLNSKGVDYNSYRTSVEIIDEIPFSTERKYMATLVKNHDGKHYLFVKGAPEIVYSLCKRIPEDAAKRDVDALLIDYQNHAMRTLGFGWADAGDAEKITNLENSDLIFCAIAAISDPVRKEVPQAVREALDAGVGVKIVTGDTPATAREIGRQVGLWNDSIDGKDEIITGPEIGELTDEQLEQKAGKFKIIARARPMDKKRLVEALQRRGEIVAVTGDGTNDAPALKAAHVGLSMGDGTSVAKEASDITIVDNSFTSIGRAVMWGRSLYQNIQRFILFQMTVNVVACLIVLIGAFLGTQSPLTVTQMLWVNLIMDTFAAMALAALPPSESVMRDKPRRRSDFIINKPMRKSILLTGGIFTLLLLGLLIIFDHTNCTSLLQLFGANGGLVWTSESYMSEYELSLFFSIFVYLQVWNMFNARAYATGKSALHLKGCGEFTFIAALIFVGQILIVEFGRQFFSVTPLNIIDWIIVIGGTSFVLWIGEALRLLKKS